MFSGIVEELGRVKDISRRGKVILLTIEANKVLEDASIGDSIAVNGCCLTAIKKEKNTLSFEVMSETAKVTNLGVLRISDKVNLERSLKVGDRISGHFVLGHVDCLGIIRSKGYWQDNLIFQVAAPAQFSKYLILKGSVSLDGISLTIGGKSPGLFSVYIIPHTFKNTTLGFKGPSDKVNIEFDILAKRNEIS
ncbi:MAG: riboflavin synthase [Candidatus Omnitrophica bacterium]|nr:riboflavin synthase [Candidatus Omnitrophota bacterium]